MTKKEAIETIKNATKAIGQLFYVEDEKFEAVKVKDGSQDVSVEGEYAKGTKVSVSSSTGSIPAPDGKYTLSNGKSFTTKGGVITDLASDNSDEDFSTESEADKAETEKVVTPEAEAEKVETPLEEAEKIEEVISEEAQKVETEVNTEIKDLTDKVNGIEEAFNLLKEAFATKEDLKLIGEKFNTIKSAFDVLSDTPAEFSKVDKSVLAKEEKTKKLEALAGLMKK